MTRVKSRFNRMNSVFVLRDEPFDRSEFSRRERVEVRGYLDDWAGRRGLAGLLARARSEAGTAR